MTNTPIDLNEIWRLTDGGRTIIEDIYPQSKESFSRRKNFKIRSDDKQASAGVFLDKTKTFWFLKDHGGGNTNSRNAIHLIQELKGFSYFDALRFAWETYCGGSFKGSIAYPEPKIEKTSKKVDEIKVTVKKEFTEFELATLGPSVKPEHCKDFSLASVDYYITKEGFKISSTETYPIYYYDYGTWGKLYQPFSKDFRFIYTGTKPESFIFSDFKTAGLLRKIKNGEALSTDTDSQERQLEEVIWCTGPSDAINVYSAGYRVVWFNSETAKFTDYDYRTLRKLAKEIYLLPDLDQTGVREALKIGIRFLDIKIIWLPEDLKYFKDWKGKPCKDARDFFKYYKSTKYHSSGYYFKKLVETSLSLKFWSIFIEKDIEGSIKSRQYEISNEHAYMFLNAVGFYTMPSKANKSEYSFIQITDNVVEEINEKTIQERINHFLINFLKQNLEYYDIKLINAIHRTNQLKLASLAKLKRIEPDFKSYGPGFDFIFFTNCAVSITGEKVEKFPLNSTGKYVLKEKIIDHHFSLNDAPFSIDFAPEYKALQSRLYDPDASPVEKEFIKQKLDGFRDLDKFRLEIIDNEFSIIRYLFNTGRVHWRKEETKQTLTDDETKEQNLHFINKIIALGYCIYRYKEQGMAFAPYAMENSQGLLGLHRGGTGKSFFFRLIKAIRKTLIVDGQQPDLMKDKHMFSGVVKGVTEFICFDDVSERHDLHTIMNPISGEMEVEPKFVNKYTLEFNESPKIGFTSNHQVRNIDDSLKRRIWFLGFSDYYHTYDRSTNTKERTMLTEFGKNLITDFTPDEMNKYYNLMAWCLHFYLKFHQKVDPPMENIEKRNLQGLLGDDFLYWAEEYFTPDKLNINIDRQATFKEYLNRFSEKERRFIKPQKFKERLKLFAEYNNWQFNPQDLMKSNTEVERKDIREFRDGADVYCFHFRTPDYMQQPVTPVLPELKAINPETKKPNDLPF